MILRVVRAQLDAVAFGNLERKLEGVDRIEAESIVEQRRFGIDFDRACKVLDELQQAGLIGPYIGGRSRDILLTREEWLPHAPQA